MADELNDLSGVADAINVLGKELRIRSVQVRHQQERGRQMATDMAYYKERVDELNNLVSKQTLENKSLEEKLKCRDRRAEKLEAEIDSLKAKLKAKKK